MVAPVQRWPATLSSHTFSEPISISSARSLRITAANHLPAPHLPALFPHRTDQGSIHKREFGDRRAADVRVRDSLHAAGSGLFVD